MLLLPLELVVLCAALQLVSEICFVFNLPNDAQKEAILLIRLFFQRVVLAVLAVLVHQKEAAFHCLRVKVVQKILESVMMGRLSSVIQIMIVSFHLVQCHQRFLLNVQQFFAPLLIVMKIKS